MRTLRAAPQIETKKAIRRTKSAIKVVDRKSASALEVFLIILKYLDNAVCHGITGIGIWLILEKLGILMAIHHHYLGMGGGQ